MGINNLTTLATAKQWIALEGSKSDAMLIGLIGRLSQRVMDYLQRDSFISQTYTEVMDGTGTRMQMLRHWPVTSVTDPILVNNVLTHQVPADTGAAVPSASARYGYRFKPWNGQPPGFPVALEGLGGLTFGNYGWSGHQNITVTYTAGYLVANEAQTVPASGEKRVTTTQPYGAWIADNGVTLSNGTPLVQTDNPSPATGQYNVDENNPGDYLFGDAGISVLISYSYCPATVEQTVLDLINDRLAQRTRPGVRSQSLATQETVTYDTSGFPAYAVQDLAPYRHIILV